MYIAFKWLLGLAFAMWIAMCGIDLYRTIDAEIRWTGTHTKLFGFIFKNTTVKSELEPTLEKYPKEKHHGVAVFHFIIFLSGALAVSILHRKNEIISFTKSTIPKIAVSKTFQRVWIYLKTDYLKNTAKKICVVIVKKTENIWKSMGNLFFKFLVKINNIMKREKSETRQGINFMLLKRLKEIGEEKKNLGQLLIAAIHENKNIRMHYQLENLAKNRLVRHIENTQKEIKENRSRYVSFQQLYLVTHQENAYLKSRIRKLAKDKEEAEKNLMDLLNEVYKSKNNELKVYCSRFIVRTKDNLLNSDVGAEIQKFLQKSHGPVASTSNHSVQLSECSVGDIGNMKTRSSRVSELLHGSDTLVPLVSEAPKLKGLPGEYVWTVKDKHGIIEKLYEYDYESNINDGDTIKRIRQYSVYYDKDCLLDFSKSKTLINEINTEVIGESDQFVEYPLTRERFLTGSEAFQKFLQSNKSVMST